MPRRRKNKIINRMLMFLAGLLLICLDALIIWSISLFTHEITGIPAYIIIVAEIVIGAAGFYLMCKACGIKI